jgi:two-component system cell cycle sensor histidine kinase/response regulator CckA
VILNYADFAAEQLEGRPEVRTDIDEVRHAARTDLTRQLLVFSRREVLKPEPLDLNTVVHEMENLLTRTIGSHIEFETRLAPGLPTALSDPGEIEQILVNLTRTSPRPTPR